jgi:hypothetical protein
MPAFTTQLTSQTTAGNEDLTAQPGWKAQMGPQPPDQGPRPDQKRPRPRQIGRKIDGRKMSREANAMDHFSAINLSALQNQPCPSERVAPGLCHQPGLIQQPHHRGATAHKAHLTAILAHPARPDEPLIYPNRYAPGVPAAIGRQNVGPSRPEGKCHLTT